jgi:hypothetical protein
VFKFIKSGEFNSITNGQGTAAFHYLAARADFLKARQAPPPVFVNCLGKKNCNFAQPPVFYYRNMNNQPENPNESLWRRKPTDAEREMSRAQPGLELETRLTEALAKAPDAPVPSNFTARVMDAIELEEKRAGRSTWNWHRLFPRIAVATAVLIFSGISIQRYEVNSHRAALAKEVATVTASQPWPSMDALEDLDAIQHMSQSNPADTELLAALQ